MRHGLLGLALLALMACVHAPHRPRQSPPPEALSPAPPASPAPAVSPAPAPATADAAAAPSSVSAASPEAASPEAPAAQAAGSSPTAAKATSASAPPAASTTPADASPAPVPVRLAGPAAATLPPDVSAAAADAAGAASGVADEAPRAPSAQVPGLAPALYGDLFDRMRAGFTLEDGAGQRAVDQQLRWYANNPEYLQRAFGRAELYLYQIVTELERRGMPRELALLPVVESAFEPYAYSRARASGLWQFVPGTASRFGLKQDWWYDGRRDIVESTRAALDYLQSLHDRFNGDWLLAIAAYNCGATDPGGPHYLLMPIAAADVFTENIEQLSADQRLGVSHYTVRRGDSLASLARKFHTTVNVIRELNDMPSGALTVGNDLRVPSAVTELPEKVMLAAARVDGHGRSARRPHVQIVRRGDSLWTIARHNGMNVNTLARLNGMHPDDALRAGQRIKLTAASAGSGRSASRRRLYYTVREGDTVSQIARLFQCSVPQIMAWNGLSSHSGLHAGQKLRIH